LVTRKEGVMANITRCRSCGANIIWIQMKSGKKMPVDAAIRAYKKNPQGKENIVTELGEVVRADIVSTSEAEGVGYISHFATCPYAKARRK